jgi:hypothetical protein
MKDRIYMALAFVGFIVIAIVVMNNYDYTQDEKTFGVGNYYTPSNVTTQAYSVIELYQQMTGSRKMTCPVTSLSKTNDTTFDVSTLSGNNYRNSFNCYTVFISMNVAGADNKNLKDKNTLASDLKAAGIPLKTADTVTLGELFPSIQNAGIVELIAPFAFKFGNVNSTSVDSNGDVSLIIINTSSNCRITFNKIDNWFCAGVVGTSQTLNNNSENNVVSWEDHKAKHKTIIGSTTNAELTGGSTGDVIGYANAESTVLIEQYTASGWQPISLYDMLTTDSKK